VIDGAQAVFAVAAPIALAGLLVVLALKEIPMRSPEPHEKPQPRQPELSAMRRRDEEEASQ
jgi:hypothetical protein